MQCSKPLVGAPLTTGSDEIPLKTTGRKWYICGVSGHCSSGQKLVITVLDGSAAPAPTPTSPSTGAASGSIISTAGFAAEGKTFFVGDSLGTTILFSPYYFNSCSFWRFTGVAVFNYPAGKHNVFKVNGTDFQDCAKPLAAAPPLTSGSDEIPLKTAGKKWYICGVSGHCASGQKLVITVSEGSAPPAGYSSSGVAMVNIGFAALVLVGTLGMLFF
ncbi:unnamed protein product [Linum tenue]|uniref:Phytocyanin domain-containing protein n=1 Tax=Linum tenue TaxID=586396 RepID=A0AAV0JVL3_9ROSI|nr:unnamed protein product [Linum tenue]